MNPLLRHGAAHVFVESLDAPELSGGDQHHLGRVLRIRPDDAITVSDGAGNWVPATWSVSTGVLLTGAVIAGAVIADDCVLADDARLTVGCALPKGDRPELIVQKLTELGLDRIVFYETQRSVVRWDDHKVAVQTDRLRRVAREAAMQSRRVVLPTVEVIAWSAATRLPAVALAEPGGDTRWWSPQRGIAGPVAVRSVLVGPEGGFTEDELAMCARRVALSPTILRVETAAIVAGVLLMSGLGGPDS